MTLKRQRFEPAKNSDCLCGSGLKFKRCCFGKHTGDPLEYNEKALKSLEEKNYEEAIGNARVAVTIYTIFHLTNTVPLLRIYSPEEVMLLQIDINALADHVRVLKNCYEKSGEINKFEGVLESLRGNILDKKWQKKVTYFQVLTRLEPMEQNKVGCAYLSVFEPIDEEDDIDILKLYYCYMNEELDFTRRKNLCKRIIELSEDTNVKFRYSISEAIEHFYINEKNECEKLIEIAINNYDFDNEDSLYGKLKYAEAVSLLGDFKKSGPLKKRALLIFDKMLDHNSWRKEELSYIHYKIANCLLHLAQFSLSVKSFNKAYELDQKEIILVYKAIALRHFGDESCISVISKIDVDSLNKEEFHDYVINYSNIAICYKNRDMILKSVELLKSLNKSEPVFERDKSRIISEINDFLINNLPESGKSKLLESFKQFTKKFSRYAVIQPNFFGLGLNINNFIDDFTKEGDDE